MEREMSMKKQIIVATVSVLLSALILLLLPPLNSGTPTPTVPTDPTVTTNMPDTVPPVPGVVRLYTCDPEKQAVYVGFAAEYSALTGTEVIVMGPDGEDCEAALDRLLESDEPPTIFCLHSQAALEKWKNRLYDLRGTAAAAALCSPDFGVMADGRMLGLAADVEGYGLIYNAALLARTGFSRTDVGGFNALSTIVRYITDNPKFGFSAFGMPSLSDPGSRDTLALLASMCSDAGDLREFVDLYRQNCLKDSPAADAFLKGKTVFYLGGTWDYQRVAALEDRNLDILPAYTPGGGMRYFCREYWCVNGSVYRGDILASLDFLRWMVTAQEDSAAPVDRLGLFSPFRDATTAENPLEKKLRGFMGEGTAVLSWGSRTDDLTAFGEALAAYMASATEENWDAVAAWIRQ